MTSPPALTVLWEELREYSGALDTDTEAFSYSYFLGSNPRPREENTYEKKLVLPARTGPGTAPGLISSWIFTVLEQGRFSWLRNLQLRAVEWLTVNTDKWALTGIPVQGAWLQSPGFSASSKSTPRAQESKSGSGSQLFCKGKDCSTSFHPWKHHLEWMEGKLLNNN